MELEKIMELLSRFAFASASLVLMAMSFALVIYGVVEIVAVGISSWKDAGGAMLAAIGYVVIAMAVFDVAKYFIEEEVIRGREMRERGEARRSLTKFVSTIAIAVFIEGLVIVFQASKDDLPEHALSDRAAADGHRHRRRARRLSAAQRRGRRKGRQRRRSKSALTGVTA